MIPQITPLMEISKGTKTISPLKAISHFLNFFLEYCVHHWTQIKVSFRSEATWASSCSLRPGLHQWYISLSKTLGTQVIFFAVSRCVQRGPDYKLNCTIYLSGYVCMWQYDDWSTQKNAVLWLVTMFPI